MGKLAEIKTDEPESEEERLVRKNREEFQGRMEDESQALDLRIARQEAEKIEMLIGDWLAKKLPNARIERGCPIYARVCRFGESVYINERVYPSWIEIAGYGTKGFYTRNGREVSELICCEVDFPLTGCFDGWAEDPEVSKISIMIGKFVSALSNR